MIANQPPVSPGAPDCNRCVAWILTAPCICPRECDSELCMAMDTKPAPVEANAREAYPTISDEMVAAYVAAANAVWEMRTPNIGDRPERAVREGLAAVVPLIRAQVAAELVAEARKVQAAIDDPATDADVMGTLIDECEGMWTAIRIVDYATWYACEGLSPGVHRERDGGLVMEPDGPRVDLADLPPPVVIAPPPEGQERSEGDGRG